MNKELICLFGLILVQVTSMLGMWPAMWVSAVLFFVTNCFIWLCVSMAVASLFTKKSAEI